MTDPLPPFGEFFAALRKREEGEPVVLELSASYAFLLVGQLQLAMRHPGNQGVSRETMRGLCELVADQVCGNDPVLRRVYEAGWFNAYGDTAGFPADLPAKG